jgi:hypothetical protein
MNSNPTRSIKQSSVRLCCDSLLPASAKNILPKMLGKNHLAEPNQHVFIFHHPMSNFAG